MTLLFFWIGIVNLVSQDHFLYVQHFGVEDGLSHRFVYHTFQDSRGLIWISTKYGLNRFDGQNFKNFTKETNGLSNNTILQVLEDPNGWLWVFSSQYGSEYGWNDIDLLNIQTMEVIPWKQKYPEFPKDSIELCISNASVGVIVKKKNGEIRLLDKSGKFSKINISGLRNFTPKYISKKGTIWGIEQYDDFINWIEIDTSGKQLNKIINKGYKNGFLIGEDEKDQFWYYCRKGSTTDVFYINNRNQRKQYDITNTSIGDLSNKIYAYNTRILINPIDYSYWLIGNNFFHIEIPKGNPVQINRTDLPKLNSLRNVMFDNKGAAWISTVFGVYRMKIKTSKFKNFLSKKVKDENKVNLIECRGIMESDEGNIFVNSNKGTFLISPDGKILNSDYFKQLDPQQTIPVFTLGIYKAGDDLYWFGYQVPVRVNTKTNEFELFYDKNIKRGLKVWSFYRDTTGTMWFGGLGGNFYFLEPGDIYFKRFKVPDGSIKLKKAGILQIFEDKNKKVWLSTTQGLFLFDPYNKIILQHYWTGGKGRFFIPNSNIHFIHEDSSGVFWLASGGGGLIQLKINSQESSEKHYHQYQIADGLSSNVIYAIYEDDYDNLWMSSDYGIIKFNKKTKLSQAFLPKDGLPYYEFNRISGFQNKDGTIYFGGLNGLTSFNPKDFQNIENKEDYPLVLIDLQQFDGSQNKLMNKLKEFTREHKIVFYPKDRMARIYFALLNYEDYDHVRYFYKIKELDRSWTYLRQNNITLSGLPYGDFTLEIKAQSASGIFSDRLLIIPVEVLKPFYLKSWFIVLAVLFLLGIIWFYIYTRNLTHKKQKLLLKQEIEKQTKIIKEQNIELKEKTEKLVQNDHLKSRFFANISHELRTPLTLLLGPLKMVLKKQNTKNTEHHLLDSAYRNSLKLYNLINEMLDLSKMESGKLKLNEYPVQLYPLLRRCFVSFESTAEIKGISFQLNYLANKDLTILIDENKFEKIVSNYISNALKFTPKNGQVIVELKDLGDSLLLSVKDNGKGIHPDDMSQIFERFFQTNKIDASIEGGTGIGLALVKEFAHLFNGKVWAENNSDNNSDEKGSVFYFKWPKKEAKTTYQKENGIEVTINNDVKPVNQLKKTIREHHIEKPTILVVEDNPDMRDYICFTLEEKYNLITAENGKIALDKLKIIPDCQLILSDIMMPVMDGFRLTEKLKSDNRYSNIPVIMLTARADIKDKLKALRIGVDDYILKPFEVEELLVRINNLLIRYRERKIFIDSIRKEDMREDKTGKSQELHLLNLSDQPSKEDTEWLMHLEKLILKEVQNDLLTVSWLADQLNISERHIQRRLKSLTGLNPNIYIREIRLQEARYLLENRLIDSVKKAAWKVSYRDEKYFSNIFKERFGKLPSNYFSS